MAGFEGFFVRGLFSVFLSRGMENLAAETNAIWPGTMQVSDHGTFPFNFCNVPWLTDQCAAIHKRGKKIVLSGHSFGGTAVIMVNQRLQAIGIKVDLLMPIDPAAQYPTIITPNAQRVVGFYQKTFGQLGQGVDQEGKGWTDAEWKARSVEYRRYETHLAIANDPFVHKTIIDEIRKVA